MTSATLSGSAAVLPPSDWRRHLVEFLVVGGATVVLTPFAWLYRHSIGLDEAEYLTSVVAFYAAYVINDPHFAVTYLLFYRNVRERIFGRVWGFAQRVRYVLAGLVVPIVLAGWAAYALASHSAHVLGLMIQLMFFLVGWHYVKQGFGVLTVLSARRGVRWTQLERNIFLAHCFCGWFYAKATPADLGSQFEESGVVYTSIPHPPGLEAISLVLFGASAGGVVWVLARMWLRDRRLPPLAPLSGMLISIWLWTVYSDYDPLMAYVIPGLHSVQYLYFVWLLKKNEAKANPATFGGNVLGRLAGVAGVSIVLGWFMFHGAPEFLDGALVLKDPDRVGGLGPTPYVAAFATFVNIHHYFMDFVIWRRDNPETRYLMG